MAHRVVCPFCGGDTEYLTVAQTARLLGVSDRIIRKYVYQGRFPGATQIYTVQRTPLWRIPASAVLPLVEARRNNGLEHRLSE